MAEVSTGGGGKGKGKSKQRSKKVSTKIDMTPMVDLAFLLITFFMLTTTMAKPQAMEVNMPDKTKEKITQPIKESQALTVILGEDNKVYWYTGITDPKVQVTDFSADGIRKVLTEKNKTIREMVVVIKSMDTSKYKNMVDLIDEMHITGIQRFAPVAITEVDKELIKKAL
jgi:biopolymer transport protein ExbD